MSVVDIDRGERLSASYAPEASEYVEQPDPREYADVPEWLNRQAAEVAQGTEWTPPSGGAL